MEKEQGRCQELRLPGGKCLWFANELDRVDIRRPREQSLGEEEATTTTEDAALPANILHCSGPRIKFANVDADEPFVRNTLRKQSWFPVTPSWTKSGGDNHLQGVSDHRDECSDSDTSRFTIEVLPLGSFDKDLGGAGGHNGGGCSGKSPMDLVVLSGYFKTREKFADGESESDFISFIPKLHEVFSANKCAENGEPYKHSVEEITGIVFEYLTSTQGDMFKYDLTTAQNALDKPHNWMSWADGRLAMGR